MNKIIFMLTVLLGLVLTSCSSDEPSIEINKEVVRSYQEGGVTRCFERIEVNYLVRDNPNSKWKPDESGTFFEYFPNKRILFAKGQVWTLVDMPMHWGSVVADLRMTWGAYQDVTGNKNTLYVTTPFHLDEENKIMMVGSYMYTVEKMTEKELRISTETEEGKTTKLVYKYRIYDMPQAEIDNILTFDSRKEAYRHIIKVAREQFGNKIDLNEIYKPNIIFDEPIIDLDKLEEMVENEEYLM